MGPQEIRNLQEAYLDVYELMMMRVKKHLLPTPMDMMPTTSSSHTFLMKALLPLNNLQIKLFSI
jgi:hypothetical protein